MIAIFGKKSTGKTTFSLALAKEIGKTPYVMSYITDIPEGVEGAVFSDRETFFKGLAKYNPEKNVLIVDSATALWQSYYDGELASGKPISQASWGTYAAKYFADMRSLKGDVILIIDVFDDVDANGKTTIKPAFTPNLTGRMGHILKPAYYCVVRVKAGVAEYGVQKDSTLAFNFVSPFAPATPNISV